ncbi:MAG: hypothetical protein ACRDUS_12970 [Mycobacterium sp.]
MGLGCRRGLSHFLGTAVAHELDYGAVLALVAVMVGHGGRDGVAAYLDQNR